MAKKSHFQIENNLRQFLTKNRLFNKINLALHEKERIDWWSYENKNLRKNGPKINYKFTNKLRETLG